MNQVKVRSHLLLKTSQKKTLRR